jgi:hypothetical protein
MDEAPALWVTSADGVVKPKALCIWRVAVIHVLALLNRSALPMTDRYRVQRIAALSTIRLNTMPSHG